MTKQKLPQIAKFSKRDPKILSLYRIAKNKTQSITYFEELNNALYYLEQGNYQDFFKIFEFKEYPNLSIEEHFIEILKKLATLKNIAQLIREQKPELAQHFENVSKIIKNYVDLNDSLTLQQKTIGFHRHFDKMLFDFYGFLCKSVLDSKTFFELFFVDKEVIGDSLKDIALDQQRSEMAMICLAQFALDKFHKADDFTKFLAENFFHLNSHPNPIGSILDLILKFQNQELVRRYFLYLSSELDSIFESFQLRDDIKKILNYCSKNYDLHLRSLILNYIDSQLASECMKKLEYLEMQIIPTDILVFYFEVMKKNKLFNGLDKIVIYYFSVIDDFESHKILREFSKFMSHENKQKFLINSFTPLTKNLTMETSSPSLNLEDTMVQLPIENFSLEYLKTLKEFGIDEQENLNLKISALKFAIEVNSYQSFKVLLTSPLEFDRVSADNFCPLKYALELNNFAIAEYILENNLIKFDSLSIDHFRLAIQNGNIQVLRLLTQKFPDITSDQYQELIEITITNNYPEALVLLSSQYKSIIDLNKIRYLDQVSISPLMLAVSFEHLEATQVLIDLGLDINFRNDDHDILSIAIILQNHDMIKLLLKNNVEIKEHHFTLSDSVDFIEFQDLVDNYSKKHLQKSMPSSFVEITRSIDKFLLESSRDEEIEELRCDKELYYKFSELKENLSKLFIALYQMKSVKDLDEIIENFIARETDLSIFTISLIAYSGNIIDSKDDDQTPFKDLIMLATKISKECIKTGDLKDDSKTQQHINQSLQSFVEFCDQKDDLLHLKLNQAIDDFRYCTENKNKLKSSNIAKFKYLQKAIKLTQKKFEEYQKKFPQELKKSGKKQIIEKDGVDIKSKLSKTSTGKLSLRRLSKSKSGLSH